MAMVNRLLIFLLLAGNAMGAAYTINLTGAAGSATVTPLFNFAGTIEVKVDTVQIKFLTSGVEDSISLTVGQTLEYVCSDWESITVLDIRGDKVSGDISGWALPNSLTLFYIFDTSVSGDISGWTLPSSLTQIYVRNTSVSGDISDWTLPSGLTQISVNNTSVDYDASGGAFIGVTNSLVAIDFAACSLSFSQVDNALADLVTSGINTKTLDIAGSNSGPSCVGEAYKDILVTRGWTVSINARVGNPCIGPILRNHRRRR